MFEIHWRLPNVLLCCTPTNLGVWAVAVPGKRENVSILLNSSFSLNWGLFNRSSTCMASLRRRHTADTRTIHRINNVCCAVASEKIITGGVNSLKFLWCFKDVYLRLSQNIDPLLNLLGKMNSQTPSWINWNSFDRYAGCFNFAFSSGCYNTVHKLTDE